MTMVIPPPYNEHARSEAVRRANYRYYQRKRTEQHAEFQFGHCDGCKHYTSLDSTFGECRIEAPGVVALVGNDHGCVEFKSSLQEAA